MTLLAPAKPLRPPWLRIRPPSGAGYERMKSIVSEGRLHTVCAEARCLNLPECWDAATAAFMVLGDICTRICRFCSVSAAARPPAPDPLEPEHLADSIAELELRYAVITTVCRDDLPDQGASHIAVCIRRTLERNPGLFLEALVPDFRGETGPLATVVRSGAHVVAHNIETVERLTPAVRDRRAGYHLSLQVLRSVKSLKPDVKTKSSIMLGLGETGAEILAAFRDLRGADVDALTLGQYLRPAAGGRHLPVAAFIPPEEFERYGSLAREMGFAAVASGPLVRSSYRAGELLHAA